MQYLTAAINAGVDFHRNEIASGLIQDEMIEGWLNAVLMGIEAWESCDRFLDQWQELADETRELTARWFAPVLPIVSAIAFWLFLATARAAGWCWGHTQRWWWMAWETAIAESIMSVLAVATSVTERAHQNCFEQGKTFLQIAQSVLSRLWFDSVLLRL
ncbi:MAG: hypothetical protein AAF215_33615 [Cyanobacteria bacterium P01_A01_bin.123]